MTRGFIHKAARPWLAALLFLALATLCPPLLAHAAGTDKDKARYDEIQREIKAKEDKLRQTREQEGVTLKDLDQTNRELDELTRKLNSHRDTLRATQREAQALKHEIGVMQKKLQTRKEWMQKKLKAMYRLGRLGMKIQVLTAAQDMPEFFRRWKYLEVLARHEAKEIEKYKADLLALEAKEKELEDVARRLEAQRRDLEHSEDALSQKAAEKKQQVASLRKERESYQGMIDELRRAAESMLKELERQAVEEPDTYDAGQFKKMKGRLPWPAQGNVIVPYGTQADPQYKTPVFRNGIYIGAPEGSTARAVYDGKVAYAEWFKGYGQVVVLNHGDGYHTLYANLSEIFLKKGDIIKKGGNVGKVGSSGMLDQPSLYFEVRYQGKPLNPAQWLGSKKGK